MAEGAESNGLGETGTVAQRTGSCLGQSQVVPSPGAPGRWEGHRVLRTKRLWKMTSSEGNPELRLALRLPTHILS